MCRELAAFILAVAQGTAAGKQMAEKIRDARGYRWVRVYKLTRGDLLIVSGTGDDPPCYPRFPATQGLCGAAVEARETILVKDVRKDVRYLPTFGSTPSDIVVPIISSSERVGRWFGAVVEQLDGFPDGGGGGVERRWWGSGERA